VSEVWFDLCSLPMDCGMVDIPHTHRVPLTPGANDFAPVYELLSEEEHTMRDERPSIPIQVDTPRVRSRHALTDADIEDVILTTGRVAETSDVNSPERDLADYAVMLVQEVYRLRAKLSYLEGWRDAAENLLKSGDDEA
jgi:hypothetical protein